MEFYYFLAKQPGACYLGTETETKHIADTWRPDCCNPKQLMVACQRGMLLSTGPREVLVAGLCPSLCPRHEEQQFGAEPGCSADIEELGPSCTQSLIRGRPGRVWRSRSSFIISSTVFACFVFACFVCPSFPP